MLVSQWAITMHFCAALYVDRSTRDRPLLIIIINLFGEGLWQPPPMATFRIGYHVIPLRSSERPLFYTNSSPCI